MKKITLLLTSLTLSLACGGGGDGGDGVDSGAESKTPSTLTMESNKLKIDEANYVELAKVFILNDIGMMSMMKYEGRHTRPKTINSGDGGYVEVDGEMDSDGGQTSVEYFDYNLAVHGYDISGKVGHTKATTKTPLSGGNIFYDSDSSFTIENFHINHSGSTYTWDGSMLDYGESTRLFGASGNYEYYTPKIEYYKSTYNLNFNNGVKNYTFDNVIQETPREQGTTNYLQYNISGKIHLVGEGYVELSSSANTKKYTHEFSDNADITMKGADGSSFTMVYKQTSGHRPNYVDCSLDKDGDGVYELTEEISLGQFFDSSPTYYRFSDPFWKPEID